MQLMIELIFIFVLKYILSENIINNSVEYSPLIRSLCLFFLLSHKPPFNVFRVANMGAVNSQVWDIYDNANHYRVILLHNTFTGRKVVHLNGEQIIETKTAPIDNGGTFEIIGES